MNKFSIKRTATINIPESFREDLLELCGLIEDDGLDFIATLEDILDAPANETEWRNLDGSVFINFYKDDEKGT